MRLKKFLEMRGADGGPRRMLCALPALWVGLIYEPEAQAQALDLISDWTAEEREYLRVEVREGGGYTGELGYCDSLTMKRGACMLFIS